MSAALDREQAWCAAVDRFLSIEKLRGSATASHDIAYRTPGRTTLEDGRWLGCYAQPSMAFSPQWMQIDVKRRGDLSELESTGVDPIGSFSLDGSFVTLSGETRLRKHYDSGHDVLYAGVVRGEVLRGCWTIRNVSRGLFLFVHSSSLAPERAKFLAQNAHTAATAGTQLLALATSPFRALTLFRHGRLLREWEALYPELASWIHNG